MALQRQSNLDEAKDWLARLSLEFEANAALRHLDGNIEIEPFFRDLLNLLFGWSLRNANWAGVVNQDSFDLDDQKQRIAVQVTSTMGATKIRDTLKTFLPTHRSAFDRLLFVYPLLTKPTSSADFASQLGGFDFDAVRDRLDLRDLLRAMQNLPIDRQDEALRLLRKELQPLGAALRFGVDQNVEAIIGVILHISAGLPTTLPEMKPDATKKLKRFQEHAVYLKRQFTTYVECYRAVQEAREAIGYDMVRAVRCAAWLQERSLAALDAHGGDAKLAFDAMVTHLRDQVHAAGNACDDSAMRYFLADEFGRCNVFPNPEEPAA